MRCDVLRHALNGRRSERTKKKEHICMRDPQGGLLVHPHRGWQARRGSRRIHLWCRAEDIRMRKVEDPTAEKWSE